MKSNSVRNSNIELLRLIAMFFIVAGHYLSYSGLIENVRGINQVFAFLIGSGARISVSLFLMIGIWFMVDAKPSAERILRLYWEIWFYGVSITLVLLLIGAPVSKMSLIRALFPFFFRSTWFGTAYISLLLLSPFLNRVFSLGREKLEKLIIILSIIIIPITAISGFADTWLVVISWFIYMYLMVGYYKRYMHSKVHINRYLALTIGGGFYVFMALGKMICFNNQNINSLFFYGYKLFSFWIIDYKTIPNLFCACCFFYFIISGKVKNNAFINFLAEGIFAVYIVHQIPSMEFYLWNGILHCSDWAESNHFILYSFMIILGIEIVVALLDQIRIKVLERLWIKTLFFTNLKGKIDKYYFSFL